MHSLTPFAALVSLLSFTVNAAPSHKYARLFDASAASWSKQKNPTTPEHTPPTGHGTFQLLTTGSTSANDGQWLTQTDQAADIAYATVTPTQSKAAGGLFFNATSGNIYAKAYNTDANGTTSAVGHFNLVLADAEPFLAETPVGYKVLVLSIPDEGEGGSGGGEAGFSFDRTTNTLVPPAGKVAALSVCRATTGPFEGVDWLLWRGAGTLKSESEFCEDVGLKAIFNHSTR